MGDNVALGGCIRELWKREVTDGCCRGSMIIGHEDRWSVGDGLDVETRSVISGKGIAGAGIEDGGVF